MIEKLQPYHILEDNNFPIIDSLKAGWNAYCQNTMTVLTEFDFKSDGSAILTWHYCMYLQIEENVAEDVKNRRGCRYCGAKKCKCHEGLLAWWRAAMLIALVQPLSAAAERVFSLLNNLYNSQQTRTLVDGILLSLYLSYNKRAVKAPSADDHDNDECGGVVCIKIYMNN